MLIKKTLFCTFEVSVSILWLNFAAHDVDNTCFGNIRTIILAVFELHLLLSYAQC